MDQEKAVNHPNNPHDAIRFGEFCDRELEKEFYHAEILKNLNYLKFTILLASIVYFLFIIPEYFLIRDSSAFAAVFVSRCVVLIAMLFLYYKVRRNVRTDLLIYWFTALEMIVSASFIFISNQIPNPDILIQAFGLMIIILMIFLVNNRWLISVFTSLLISAGYFLFVAVAFNGVDVSQWLAALIHILIVIFLSSVSSYSVNYYKRIQYLHYLEVVKMAETDALTGIYNKAKFNQVYVSLADNATARKLALIMFDIDDFKLVNDHYGHLIGDQVLQELTDLVRRNISETDIFSRWGGEEFIIILPDRQLAEAQVVARRLQQLIAGHQFNGTGPITCSFGVAAFKNGDDLDTVLHRVDQHLYQAKKAGKNRVE
jgi:diguanylate cyclase (GGDEF)-like protein